MILINVLGAVNIQYIGLRKILSAEHIGTTNVLIADGVARKNTNRDFISEILMLSMMRDFKISGSKDPLTNILKEQSWEKI